MAKAAAALAPVEPGQPARRAIVIKPPHYDTLTVAVAGTGPYVQHRFSTKAREAMMAVQAEGSQQGRKRKVKEPKDFDAVYEQATYRSTEGWYGIPASSFRNAMVEACRMVGFVMTQAKTALFVEADGWDEDGIGLVRIDGEPRRHDAPVRNATGTWDVRARPMWDRWGAALRIKFNAELFQPDDVANLLAHAGIGIGIGEGRPSSKMSSGCGWGTFQLVLGDQG